MTRENPKFEQKQAEDRQWVESLLVSAQKRGWFGTITIEIKRGQIDKILRAESEKPPSRMTNPPA